MSDASTILITGGTGLIGKALTAALLEKNYQVIILTRDPSRQASTHPRLRYAQWNVGDQTIDEEAVAAADSIIHLAGAGIGDRRWTKKRKQEIRSSRVDSGKLLSEKLATIPNHVKTVITASAIGWYGEDPALPGMRGTHHEFEENEPAADGFLGQTCKEWEASLEPVTALGMRLIKIRTGLVFSPGGGVLERFIQPMRFGIATILGTGKQVMSWIYIADLVRIYLTVLENPTFAGVYNAVAPQPVTNKQLVLALAKIKRGKFFIPIHIPAFLLRWVLGELSVEVLKSCTVSCSKLHIEGFTFLYPSLQAANHPDLL